MGLLQGLNITFTSRKSRTSFSQHSETVFPFSAQQKCLPAANLDLFLTLNSVWEKFLSPMDLTQCARFRNQPSFQSGALIGWRPYCALYLDIYVVRPVQPDGQACYKAGFWLGCSKSVVYTGGHNSYRSARDWLQVVTHRNPTHTVWVTMVGEASTRIWNRAIFKQGKTTRTCYFG